MNSVETFVNKPARPLALALLLATAPAMALEHYGPFEIAGFAKDEFSYCDNCSQALANPSSYDPRGVLNPPNPMLNQPGPVGRTSANLGLAMLAVGVSHEFDNAVKIEAMASGRVRNNGPDIFGNYLIDTYVGIAYPKIGSLDVGKMTSRSWTRSDSFAYPMGLSVPWAEMGAGYGVFPQAVRLATREYEMGLGKIRFEVTGATASKRYPINVSSLTVQPPTPQLIEAFIQWSNAKNLVEFIFQDSRGGRQSSFSKGAFYGAEGNTDDPSTSPDYKAPTENVAILQGTYWKSPQWKFSYGLKRSEWSGQQAQCDFGPVPTGGSNCFWDQPGFNYATDFQRHHAIEWDVMGGGGYTRGLYTYTLGAVHFNKAYVRTPTEWGQSNTATVVNLGIYRKVPEISKHMEVYGGLGKVVFGHQGPAPVSMPNNTAMGGVDPRVSQSGNSLTVGANFIF